MYTVIEVLQLLGSQVISTSEARTLLKVDNVLNNLTTTGGN
mgnify:CR=1 FL=1